MSAITSSSAPAASARCSYPANFAADGLPRTLGSSRARSPPSRMKAETFHRLTGSCIAKISSN